MSLSKSFNSLWDDFYSLMPEHRLPTFRELTPYFPKYDLEEFPNRYVYSFDIPGVNKEDIKITENNGIVTISGSRKSEVKEEKSNYRYSECRYGSFSRRFKLEHDAHPDHMSANMDNGVLKLSVTRTKDENENLRHVNVT